MEPRAEAGNSWVEESAAEAEDSREEPWAVAGNSSVGELAVEVLEAVANF